MEGRSIGKVSLKLKVINELFFNQSPLYARTEDGVIYMNSMFKNYIGRDHSLQTNGSTSKIFAAFDTLVNTLYDVNHMMSCRQKDWDDISRKEKKALAELRTLINLLNYSLE